MTDEEMYVLREHLKEDGWTERWDRDCQSLHEKNFLSNGKLISISYCEESRRCEISSFGKTAVIKNTDFNIVLDLIRVIGSDE